MPLSVGVARTKHLAKVASQVAKPDGLVVVEAGDERGFLDPLPVELIWGVGPATRSRLSARGVRTIGHLAEVSPSALERLLGIAAGSKLADLAANIDPRRIETARRAKSVGAQAALGRELATAELVRDTVGYLADRVAGRLRAAGKAGRTITVRVRDPALRSVTRSTTLAAAISSTLGLTEIGSQLVFGALAEHPQEPHVSLLAVSVSNLVDERAVQLELALGLADERLRPGTPIGSARSRVDHSVDAIRDRFGRRAIGYAAVSFAHPSRVPDEFRELAERSDD